jgi:CPA2 family monovalent cation:H+ antiporter-2
MEAHHLLHDLGWLMATAAFVSILLRWLKQPAIIGYLLAGVLLGPHLLPWSPVHEGSNLSALSELGVLFLMFYIGLEFDLSKLKPVAPAAALGLALQTVLMLMLGTTVGQWQGWSAVQGLFLGGILAISSSMVCFNLIRERGDIHRPYAQITAGVLILEDILAIILLVVLAGVGVSGQFDYAVVGQTTFFVGIFVVAVFLVGRVLAPTAIQLLNRIGNAETLTLFTVGFIFLVSLLASAAQFSLALGSFLAGAIFSRSSISEEIEQVSTPIRDFFSALFFVTIGTLVDPAEIWAAKGTVLLVTALMMVGKFLACWTGFLLAAVPPGVATRSALAKVQIGEFGFVIAALGMSLGVTDSQLGAVMTGVAVLSIMLTPVAFGLEKTLRMTAVRLVPQRLRSLLTLYLSWVETLKINLRSSSFLRVVKRPLLRINIDFLMLTALLIVASLAARWLGESTWQRLLWGGAALGAIPFLVDILRSLDVITLALSEAAMSRPVLAVLSRGAARDLWRLGAFSIILFAFAGIFLVACAPYFPTGTSLLVFALTIVVLLVLGWRRAVKLQSQLEWAVISSMEDATRQGARGAMQSAISDITRKHPWPVELMEVEILPHSQVAGRTLRQINLRRDSGATIVAVQRGGVTHYDVTPDWPISPGDCVLLVAEAEQLAKAETLLKAPGTGTPQDTAAHQFTRLLVAPTSKLCGLPLLETRIRSELGVTVVGIQRGEDRITGPSPEEFLHAGDLLLVMGPSAGIEALRERLL